MSFLPLNYYMIWMGTKIILGAVVSILALRGWPNRKRIRIPLLLISNYTMVFWHLGIWSYATIFTYEYEDGGPEILAWFLPFWGGTFQGVKTFYDLPSPACQGPFPQQLVPYYGVIRWLAFIGLLLFIAVILKGLKGLWTMNQQQRQRVRDRKRPQKT